MAASYVASGTRRQAASGGPPFPRRRTASRGRPARARRTVAAAGLDPRAFGQAVDEIGKMSGPPADRPDCVHTMKSGQRRRHRPGLDRHVEPRSTPRKSGPDADSSGLRGRRPGCGVRGTDRSRLRCRTAEEEAVRSRHRPHAGAFGQRVQRDGLHVGHAGRRADPQGSGPCRARPYIGRSGTAPPLRARLERGDEAFEFGRKCSGPPRKATLPPDGIPQASPPMVCSTTA